MTDNNTHSPITRSITHSSRRIIKSLKAKADARRTWTEKTADWMVANFGSFTFQVINIVWFTIWITINIGLVPGIVPFDPFPFGLLTMLVSLEAIMLAIFVLISQNREAKLEDLREEIDLQVDVITEEELTKALKMLNLLLQKNGIDMSKDIVLQSMLVPTNVEKIEKALERQIEEKIK